MGKFHLLFRSIKERGLRETLLYVLAEYYFDFRYGTETMEIVELDQLSVMGENREHGAPYQASNYLVLRRVFLRLRAILGEDECNGIFLDFGCGKGRAMMVAMDYGFRNLEGVEFAAPLLQVCEANLQRYAAKRGLVGKVRWRLVHADATQFEISREAVTFFL